MTARPKKPAVRRVLDAVYDAGGIVAAICLVAILLVIVAQMVTRWINISVPGLSEYAGYLMASSSFLAFAHALNRGAHIRVSILLNASGPLARRILETWCFVIATALAWYFAYFAGKTAYQSWRFNDISQGQDATPLWIPQMAMVIGAILLAIALTDNLVGVLVSGRHRIRADTVEQSHGE